MSWRWCGWWRHDPGPCPVDDTPHTACTPESVGRALVTVALPRPPVLDRMLAAANPAPPAPVEFTTKTYRRAKHGPKRRV